MPSLPLSTTCGEKGTVGYSRKSQRVRNWSSKTSFRASHTMLEIEETINIINSTGNWQCFHRNSQKGTSNIDMKLWLVQTPKLITWFWQQVSLWNFACTHVSVLSIFEHWWCFVYGCGVLSLYWQVTSMENGDLWIHVCCSQPAKVAASFWISLYKAGRATNPTARVTIQILWLHQQDKRAEVSKWKVWFSKRNADEHTAKGLCCELCVLPRMDLVMLCTETMAHTFPPSF